MATYENKGRLTYKDSNGDLHRLYPVTQKECVEGMEDIDSHLVDKTNPHGVSLTQLGVTATATELNYMYGVTSNVQTQLSQLSANIEEKSPSGHTHTAADVGAVTESQVAEMINTALGVIENGSY